MEGVSIYLMVIAIDMFKGVNLCIRANSRITSVMIGVAPPLYTGVRRFR